MLRRKQSTSIWRISIIMRLLNTQNWHSNTQSPREWPWAAKSWMRLSSRVCSSFQIVEFSVFQQASTQYTDIAQLFCKNIETDGGSTSGGSSTSTEDGCVRRISSFNLEAKEMNCCTWPKDSGCCSVSKSISCSLREDISHLSKLTLLLSPYYTLFVHAMDRTEGDFPKLRFFENWPIMVYPSFQRSHDVSHSLSSHMKACRTCMSSIY